MIKLKVRSLLTGAEFELPFDSEEEKRKFIERLEYSNKLTVVGGKNL